MSLPSGRSLFREKETSGHVKKKCDDYFNDLKETACLRARLLFKKIFNSFTLCLFLF